MIAYQAKKEGENDRLALICWRDLLWDMGGFYEKKQ